MIYNSQTNETLVGDEFQNTGVEYGMIFENLSSNQPEEMGQA